MNNINKIMNLLSSFFVEFTIALLIKGIIQEIFLHTKSMDLIEKALIFEQLQIH